MLKISITKEEDYIVEFDEKAVDKFYDNAI
jgi:hypothetical protein